MSDRYALEVLLRSPVTPQIISYLAATTLTVVRIPTSTKPQPAAHYGYGSPPYSPDSSDDGDYTDGIPSLTEFITHLITSSNVHAPTLLSTLPLLLRLRSRLPPNATGLPCTPHRIFLSCLIAAAKYLNDSSPKNKHWAKYTMGLFNTSEVNLMEMQLLKILDWDLRFTQSELCVSLGVLLFNVHDTIRRNKEIKYNQQQQQQQQQHQQYLSVPHSRSFGRVTPTDPIANSLNSPHTPGSSLSSGSYSRMSIHTSHSHYSLSTPPISPVKELPKSYSVPNRIHHHQQHNNKNQNYTHTQMMSNSNSVSSVDSILSTSTNATSQSIHDSPYNNNTTTAVTAAALAFNGVSQHTNPPKMKRSFKFWQKGDVFIHNNNNDQNPMIGHGQQMDARSFV